MNIGGVAIGPDQPCAFIGELSNNANGKLDNALRLMDGLKAAGASAAKLQCYLPEELVALRGDGPAPAQWSHMTMRELYERAATPFAWFDRLYQHGRDIGLPVFSSVFGSESLALLESLGNPVYKVAALDNGSGVLHLAIHATRKPVIVSTRRDQDTVRRNTTALYGADVSFLLCPENYPQSLASFAFDRELDFDGHYCSEWEIPPTYLGISSHCLDEELPLVAVALGAKLLEYHVQLDDEPSELEANVSLTTSQFRTMIERVRRVEEMMG